MEITAMSKDVDAQNEQIVATMIEQIEVRMPKEPCTYMQAAKAKNLRRGGATLYMDVSGDRFKGIVGVSYMPGRDLYQIALITKEGVYKQVIEDVYGDQLAPFLWNATFIV